MTEVRGGQKEITKNSKCLEENSRIIYSNYLESTNMKIKTRK